VEEHCELAGMRTTVLEAVEDPDRVLAGGMGELIAVKYVEKGKHMVVVYREFETDGFVITAFLTTRTKSLDRRRQIWPSPQ